MIVRRRSGFPVVLALALLVPSLAAYVPVRAGDRERADARPFALYAASVEDPTVPLVPLDPETLADLAGGEPLALTGFVPDVLVSADGSTMVHVEHEGRTTIVVSDGVGGTERLRFQPGQPGFGQHLSHDGRRFVTMGPLACSPDGCGTVRWSVFDTGDGRVITTVEGDAHGEMGSLVDPGVERLYQLTYDRRDGNDDVGPWPVEVVAFDLTTGEEVGRLAVLGVLGGSWWTRSIDGVPVGDRLTPAIALSPDGARLLVVDAATDQLTTIDAATMRVEGTRALSRPKGVAHRALRWLGIAPRTAVAKVSAGRWLDATFAPDGQHLYLWGAETDVGTAVDDIETTGLGIMRVHVESGEVRDEAPGGMMIQEVVPAPDDTVYLHGSDPPRGGRYSGAEHLLRLDSQSLETLAEREYRSSFTIAVLPLVSLETP